jgi:hypothetical protein
MKNGTGQPTTDGVYVAEVYFGWKILAWRGGEWWHETHVGRWTASVPMQWVGPLPGRKGQPAKMEFDL